MSVTGRNEDGKQVNISALIQLISFIHEFRKGLRGNQMRREVKNTVLFRGRQAEETQQLLTGVSRREESGNEEILRRVEGKKEPIDTNYLISPQVE